ncbi:unnamed protein product [Diabrotica balteata]|uniref:Uncharacterized protein n=1 Tax=Diabrotica balteata TaxID=107213 RepID=A0A9N9SVM5_DIABA|nr:unnamed protein product [Diabrotica balteata]
MDIPSTSGKSNNTFDDSDVSSINETYTDSGSSYNPSDMEDSTSEKSKGENENVLVTDKNLQSSFQSNDIANPGEILRSRKRGARRKFADKSQWQRNIRKNYEIVDISYLCGQIKLTSKLTNTAQSDSRKYTRQYSLTKETGLDIPVCKEFFKKVLRVSDDRLTRVLRNKEQGGTPSKNKREKMDADNKTNQRIQNNDDGEDNVFYTIEDSEQMME